MNIKAIFLISILALNTLTLSFDNVNAGNTVDVKEGKIHMDALNGGTGFLWGYTISFVDNNDNVINIIDRQHVDCLHDKYYDIPANAKYIRVKLHDSATMTATKEIAAIKAGFKFRGTSGNVKVNYDYYDLNNMHEVRDTSFVKLDELGWGFK